jgi:hypothetical protein
VIDDGREDDPEPQRADKEPPGGQATSAGGGYGVGSASGSGGSGEATEPAGDDAETTWLRQAPGGSSSAPPDIDDGS